MRSRADRGPRRPGPRRVGARASSNAARALGLAVLLPLAFACRDAGAPKLQVAERLIDADGRFFPRGTVRDCEIDDDLRPALGCLESVSVQRDDLHLGAPMRLRLATPPLVRGRAAAVDVRLRAHGKSVSRLLPVQLFSGPLGEEIEVDIPPQVDAIEAGFAAEVRLRPVPPAEQAFESAELHVPARASLAFAIGLDPLARWVPSAPVEFTLAVRSGGDEAVLDRAVLDPADPGTRGWLDRRVPLAGLAGRDVRLVFRTRTLADPERPDAARGFPLWGNANLLVPATGRDKPNVVLISLDTLRADYVGVYGASLPTSPTIDAVAAEGAVFERIFSAWPSTTVSHMTMLTGLYPTAFVDRAELTRPLPRSRSLLAEILARAGWATAAVTEDGYVVASIGFKRGFDSYRENRGIEPTETRGGVAETFAEGLDWMRDHRDEAFFVFLHTYQVHVPYTPPHEYDVFTERVDAPATPEQAQARRMRAQYAGEVLYVDAMLSRLVAGLRELGLLDSTVLILTSDHGEGFGEHGLYGHAKSLYDEVLHVPFVVRAPGLVPAGVRVPALGSLADVVPTVLDLLGLPPPDDVGGRSLVPSLRDPTSPAGSERAVFAELHGGGRSLVAVRTGDRKWIFDLHDGTRSAAFDLSRDPGELRPIADPAALATGEAIRRDYVAVAGESRVRAEAAPREAAVNPAADDAVAAKLRLLGYIE